MGDPAARDEEDVADADGVVALVVPCETQAREEEDTHLKGDALPDDLLGAWVVVGTVREVPADDEDVGVVDRVDLDIVVDQVGSAALDFGDGEAEVAQGGTEVEGPGMEMDLQGE